MTFRGSGAVALAVALCLLASARAASSSTEATTGEVSPPSAAPRAAARPADPVFEIGYLLAGSDISSPDPAATRRLMTELCDFLMTRDGVREALAKRGYREVSPRACTEPFDMAQRLRAEEFELAFATAIIYARLFTAPAGQPEEFQNVAYEPILQTRAEADVPAGHAVYRRGAIFIGPSSPLWGKMPTEEEIRAELAGSRLALADAYSAAGHVYPLLKIAERFPELSLPAPIICRSSAEALKHVAAGLTRVGACETRLLEGPLGSAPGPDGKPRPLFQELMRLNPIPTDPALLRADLAPRSGQRELVNELRAAMLDFFNQSAEQTRGLRLDRAERRAYEAAARALVQYDQIALRVFQPAR